MNGVTCTATRRRSSTRDDKKYMREVTYKGNTRLVHYGDPNLEMQRDNPERRRNFLARHSCSEKRDPFKAGFWACYDWKNTSEKNMNGLKMVREDDSTAVYGGYGVIFHNVDLDGEMFTPETDYGISRAKGAPVHIDHTVDTVVEYNGKTYRIKAPREAVGEIIEVTPDDVGLWVELQVEKSNQYYELVDALQKTGRAGLSSGSNHTARKSASGVIEYWPIQEMTMTVTPAEPETIKYMQRIKSAEETSEATAAAVQSDIVEEETKQSIEVTIMSDETKQPDAGERLDAFEAKFAAFTDTMTASLKAIEQSAKAKQVGYIAPDSEEDHAEVKSFGDFLLAVKNKNTKRLTGVYKALNETDGSAGGYTVPKEFLARLMQVSEQFGVVRQRAMVMPVSSNQGQIPALDQTITPSAGAGQTALAGGVRAYWTGEAGAITQTEPAFNMIEYKISKLAGYTKGSAELTQDTAIGLEQLLIALFGRAVAAYEDYAFLRGDGVGKPLGVLNAPATLAAGTNNGKLTLDDAVDMLSHFAPTGGNPAWFMHRSQIPDLATDFNVDVGGTDLIQPREAVPQSILGYPIIYTEFLPAKGSKGSTVLADMGAYVIFDRENLRVDFSEHVNFLTDEGTWRFTKRLDGQPWLESYIVQNGSHNVSPFVQLDD
jgi:HK97 family phage major capsid protein